MSCVLLKIYLNLIILGKNKYILQNRLLINLGSKNLKLSLVI